MKTTLVSLLLLVSSVHATEIELVPVMQAGLLVSWQYDSIIPIPGWEHPFSFRLAITPTIKPGNIPNRKWNLQNTKTGKLLFDKWRMLPSENPLSWVLMVSQDRVLFDLLPEIKSLKVLISPDEQKVEYFISLQNLYNLYPGQFMDLTDANNRSCRVDSTKLPDITKECDNYKKELLSSRISCEVAKELFEKTILCGTFSCK